MLRLKELFKIEKQKKNISKIAGGIRDGHLIDLYDSGALNEKLQNMTQKNQSLSLFEDINRIRTEKTWRIININMQPWRQPSQSICSEPYLIYHTDSQVWTVKNKLKLHLN